MRWVLPLCIMLTLLSHQRFYPEVYDSVLRDNTSASLLLLLVNILLIDYS